MPSNSLKRTGFLLIKIVLFAATTAYILYRLFLNGDNAAHQNWVFPMTGISWLLALVVTGAMVLNWFMETVKWQLLYNKVATITRSDAWKGVLSGTAISIWMPNRMGDYFGRMLYLPGNHYGKAVICSAMGSMAQFVVTLLFGLAGLAFWLLSEIAATGNIWLPAIAAALIFCILATIYVFLPVFVPILPDNIGRFRIKRYIRVIYRFSLAERLRILGLSVLRYWVYSLQFVLLLILFQAGIPFTTALMIVWVVLLTQSLVPSFALTEVGVRGAASLFFLGHFTANTPAIMMATYSLWAINIVIPAAIGAFFILKAQTPAPETQGELRPARVKF